MQVLGAKEIKNYAVRYWDSLAEKGAAGFWNFNIKKCYRDLGLEGAIAYTTFTGWYKEWGNSRFGAE